MESDLAYRRKNHPWTSYIMDVALKDSSILLRSLFDKKLVFLGLKKINEIIPTKQFLWIEEVSKNLNVNGFQIASKSLTKILDYFYDKTEKECRKLLNINLLNWVKNKLSTQFFADLS